MAGLLIMARDIKVTDVQTHSGATGWRVSAVHEGERRYSPLYSYSAALSLFVGLRRIGEMKRSAFEKWQKTP